MVKVKHFSLFIASMFAFILVFSLASASWSDWFSTLTGKVTSNPVNLTITVTNNAPTIPRMTNLSDQAITENTFKLLVINFSARDADGVANLNDSTATLNISRGTTARFNNSCVKIQSSGIESNYSCTVDLWYFDAAGGWNISSRISDNSYSNATNVSAVNFTVQSTSAFISGPASITFASITPGSTNTTSNNDPLLLNNTGNAVAASVQINATNLRGETTSSFALWAGNFSVSNATGGSPPDECGSGTYSNVMNASVFTTLTNATLPRGNNSVNDGSTGQEQLYICLIRAGSEIISQVYSTVNESSWTVKIT